MGVAFIRGKDISGSGLKRGKDISGSGLYKRGDYCIYINGLSYFWITKM